MTPAHPTEKRFEEHIEQHLLASGYHKGQTYNYDVDLCLIPSEVIAFIEATQGKEFAKLQKQYGEQTAANLCKRLAKETAKRGTLDVLRKGIKDRGCSFRLSYFKPVSGMNPEHLFLYQQNRFMVVRQLGYSLQNKNTLDFGIFLNGLPIITCELKNSLTGQFVQEAIKQYKLDRDPKEPLFRFKRCLVHFAVGNEKVFMTTRLAGENSFFLPFNKDTENPVNPNGFRTHYLWEDILQPDTLLDLFENYLHVQEKTEKFFGASGKLEEKTNESLIFPRYHQLDVVRQLLSATKAEGVGHRYLIQHSAGSGKSNSIAWLSHQLASLYRNVEEQERLFDSIIVVTDRRVLDRQLQNTIKQFEQTTGVVVPIETNSAALKDAIEKGKDIIITTLQKFSVISKSTAGQVGKRFAVIIDEAHSSQSGESAKHLNRTLSADLEHAEEQDQTEKSLEDKILDEIKLRSKRQKNISFFAFTATPKNKTLELFGRRNQDGKRVAFHIYSMRQAIEEGFILDVLSNYMTFKRYFKLMKKAQGDKAYEKKKAIRLLTSYVDLQPHAIELKTRLMLDHFLDHTVNTIQGRGRAMVVTRSRLHAVKYYLMFRKVMGVDEMNLPYNPLVAFSGEVIDPDTGEKYTEGGMNNLPPKVGIPDAFKAPKFRILIVAEKFQTGFDEPLLHTMFVDKKLGGVNAVQTLSRLNRTMRGKDSCMVLDFVNDADAIQESFQDFYQTTLLEGDTDQNKLYDLQREIMEYEVFTPADVDAFAAVFFDSSKPREKLQPILDHARDIWRQRKTEERENFRSLLQSFNRLYGFLSQIMTFEDINLEKFYVFVKSLNRKLDRRKGTLPTEVLDAIDLDSFRIQKTYEGEIKLKHDDGELPTMGEGSPGWSEEERDALSNIIKQLNEKYGVNLTEDDKIDMQKIKEKVHANEELRNVFSADNSPSVMREKFEEVIDDILLDFVHTKLDLYKKLSQPQINRMIKREWYTEYKEAQ